MTRSPNAESLDPADTLRLRMAEASRRPSTHVETELQRLAARRLDHAADGASKRRSLRGRGHRKEPSTGAFDSPEGFVFVADT